MERARASWRSTRMITTIFCVISVGITVLQCVAYYHYWQREEEYRRQEAAQRLVMDLQSLVLRLEDAEGGEREFVITGSDEARAAYQRAKAALARALGVVEGEETALEEDGKPSPTDIEQKTQTEMVEMERTMEVRRQRGFEAAATQVGSSKVQKQTDDLRREIEGLQALEEKSVAQHTAEESRQVGANTWTFFALTATDVVLLGLGYWGINRYAAHRKRAEAALSAAWKEAEAANLAKDRLLHTVSHDLRTPLNGVMLWAEMLKHEDVNKEEAAEAIGKCAESQARLVNDLLDASRMERGALRVEMEDVLLREAVRAAAEALMPVAAERQVTLTVAVEELEGVHVRGDAFRLQQIFWNLISNAIKFSPAEGKVEVRGSVAGEIVEMEVRDHGRGIRAEFLSRVFEAYAQEEGTGRGREGLGLGLAIVKYLVEAHQGSVHAESEGEGKGARFVVRLPVMKAAVREEEGAETLRA